MAAGGLFDLSLDELTRLARTSGKSVGQFVDDALHNTPAYGVASGSGAIKYGARDILGGPPVYGVSGISSTLGTSPAYGGGSLYGAGTVYGGAMVTPLSVHRTDVVEDGRLFLSVGEETPHFEDVAPAESSEIELLARFCQTISVASVYLSSAFAKAGVVDFKPPRARPFFRPKKHVSGWHSDIINCAFAQYSDLRHALVHQWTPPADASPLAARAFLLLSDLTPARLQLLRLYFRDQREAFVELARHLDLLTEQIRLSMMLAVDLEEAETREEEAANDARLGAIQDALLAQAGETLSLTEASTRLGVSRQNLHKRIQRGSALGVLKNGEILVPTCQFVEVDGTLAVVKGLRRVTEPFLESGAGHWAAMQFVTEPDPNLETTPIDALKGGRTDAVIAAAQAYLGLDEEAKETSAEG